MWTYMHVKYLCMYNIYIYTHIHPLAGAFLKKQMPFPAT